MTRDAVTRPGPNGVVLQDPWRACWLRYSEPVEVHVAHDLSEVVPLLKRVERDVEAKGLTAAGFVAYEASAAFDAALVTHPPDGFPLAWFGLYDAAEELAAPVSESAAAMGAPRAWRPSLNEEEYHAAIGRVRDYIAAGDTYQVNFSFRLRSGPVDDPWALFLAMVDGQSAGYAAFVDTEAWTLCSASPELFFRLSGEDLVSRPMKGTRPRGRWPGEDRTRAAELQASAKDRAENVMIVDMVRNDLGRICETGSVNVAHLFDVEQYPTVLQMTSTVHGKTTAGLAGIFGALFPPASITGAPKPHTMALIRELEGERRRIYTGAIGYLAPQRDAQFNVAIRTALVDRAAGTTEYGVGGGIVWDSTDRGELAECYTKAAVLTTPRPPFDLLESLLWVPQTGYFLPEKHLARLSASAAFFGRSLDLALVRAALGAESERLSDVAHKVRLTVAVDGAIRVESGVLGALSAPYRVGLAESPVDAADRFLFHKTTQRRVYDVARAARPDLDDVLLWNAEGELTESTIANLVVELEGRLVTPPVGCGLLGGVYRAFLLESGAIGEAVVRCDELPRCTRVCLVNSVRGMWDVEVEGGGTSIEHRTLNIEH